MKNFNFLILLLIFLSNSLLAKTDYKYGFVYNYDILADYKEARESLKNWIEGIAKGEGFDVEINYYDDHESAFNDFKNKKLDLVILSHDYFFNHESEVKNISDNFWSISFGNDDMSRYCVVKRNDIKFKDYNDLRGKRVSIKQTNGISYIYLDKNSLEANKKGFEEIVTKVTYETKESTLILNTFFNKTDLSVVREDAWTVMEELNPSLKKYVSLYECSETRFSPFIGMFSKNTDEGHIKVFFSTASKLKTSNKNLQLFEIMNFNKIFKLNDEEIKQMSKFYNRYNELKEKYK